MVLQLMKDYSSYSGELSIGAIHETNIESKDFWDGLPFDAEFEFRANGGSVQIAKCELRYIGETAEQANAVIASEQMGLVEDVEKASIAVCFHNRDNLTCTNYVLIDQDLDEADKDKVFEEILEWNDPYTETTDSVHAEFVGRCAFDANVAVLHLVAGEGSSGNMSFWMAYNGDHFRYNGCVAPSLDSMARLFSAVQKVIDENNFLG